MRKQYILIQPGKVSVKWLTDVSDITQLMRDYSVGKFLDKVPTETDPNFWGEEEAILLEVKICKVRPVEVVKKWKIEE